jgi:excisionase family DNA binding protein
MAMPEQSTPQHQLSPLPRRRLYTPQSFAEALGISRRTVWRLIGQQKIRTVAISLRRRGIPAEELDRIIAGGIEQ